MEQARVGLTWLVRLFLVALVAQFFFAGVGAFGAESWDLHSAFGYGLVAGSLALLVLALAARRAVVVGTLLFVSMLVQLGLAQLDETSRWLASLHAVNALVVVGLAMMMTTRTQRPSV